MISVSALASVNSARFETFSSEDYANPDLSLQFSKPRGRLTGTIAMQGGKQNRPDAAANTRNELWHAQSTIDLKYPINERYYFTSQSAFLLQDYLEDQSFVDLDSWSQAVDVFYVYTSKLDLFSGYRIRLSDTADGVSRQDHSITLGATGSILPKLSGSLRAGYQFRSSDGNAGDDHASFTGTCSLVWSVLAQLSFSAELSKDLTITSTGVSVDASALSLSGRYETPTKFGIAAALGYAQTVHLGSRGDGRVDDLVYGDIGITRAIVGAIESALSYRYTTTFSNVSFAEYSRHSLTFSLSARY